jgi:hypothetical protein
VVGGPALLEEQFCGGKQGEGGVIQDGRGNGAAKRILGAVRGFAGHDVGGAIKPAEDVFEAMKFERRQTLLVFHEPAAFRT